MESIKKELIKKAHDLHGTIKPCGSFLSFDECFTESGGKIFFWFNDKTNSTKVEHTEIKKDPL